MKEKEWVFMVPAMFLFEFWKRAAKNREVERWLLSWRLQVNYLMAESGGTIVSVLKMPAVSTALCALVFWWHWFNAMKWYYLVLDPQNERTCIHISFPWVFILADLLKPAFRHTAKNVELHQELQSVTWGLHCHILGGRKNWDPQCCSRPQSKPSPRFCLTPSSFD